MRLNAAFTGYQASLVLGSIYDSRGYRQVLRDAVCLRKKTLLP